MEQRRAGRSRTPRDTLDEARLRVRYRKGVTAARPKNEPDLRAASGRRSEPVADATDAKALRGFPVVTQDGLGGVIPGTQPEEYVLHHDPFGEDEWDV